jgi:hypothetical protein
MDWPRRTPGKCFVSRLSAMNIWFIKLIPLLFALWYLDRCFGRAALMRVALPLLALGGTVVVMKAALSFGGPETLLWVLFPIAGIGRAVSQIGHGSSVLR